MEGTKKSMRFPIVVVVVLVALLVAVVGLRQLSQRSADQKNVRIGAVLPLTGAAAFYGEWCQKGMNLAVEQINSAAGPHGRHLGISYGDSKNTPKDGVSIAQQFALEKTPVVITAMTGVSFALLSSLQEGQQVVFMTVVTHPEATARSRWAFRYYINKGSAAETMADYAYRCLGVRRAAIIYINDEGGLGEKTAFQTRFEAAGGQLVADEPFDKAATDLRSQILRVRDKQPDAVYLSGYGRIYGVGLKQMRELGLKCRILASYELLYKATTDLAGTATEGVIFSAPSMDQSQPDAQRFVAQFKARYGQEPEIDSAFGFEVVKMIWRAMQDGVTDPATIRTRLLGLQDFDGVLGRVAVKPNGDVVIPVVIRTVSGGKIVDAPKCEARGAPGTQESGR
jgi:branched-chain amino acid transport system substrate-binding protein